MSAAAARDFIGARLRRKEDPRLITGAATYTDDIVLPRMAHVALARSSEAHARIASVDTGAAAAMPGVVAVYTGADLRGAIGTLPCVHSIEGLKEPPHPAVAFEEVNYAGDAVAVVVAETAAQAEDAARAIEVEYEPLPVVTDVVAAAGDDADLVHEGLGTNVAFTAVTDIGDAGAAFASAAIVVQERIVNQRQLPIAMEPRSVVAAYDKGQDKLTVWTTTQVPHFVRLLVAAVCGHPEHKVRVIAPEVGGGFGSKLNFYAEEALLPHLAKKLGRPLKWTARRSEDIVATIHGRDQVCDLEVAADGDGRLLAIRATLYQDLGAYHQLLTPVIPGLTVGMMPGCYTLKNLHATLHGVFTNKTPTDAYRGAGRPEATFIIERAVDLVAAAAGIDPVEVRRRNFPAADAFPFTTATEMVYDSGNYQGSLDLLLETVDYTALREVQKRRREAGELVGLGFSTYVEVCGTGPSAAMTAGGWEICELEVRRTGKVVVKTGISPHGQGEETTFAQIVADGLGVTPDDVEVLHGDTDICEQGIGTFGSRGQAVGGAALALCIETIRNKARRIAAHLLGAAKEDVVFEGGRLFLEQDPDKAVDFGRIVEAAYVAKELPPGMEPGLSANHTFDPPNFTFPFGAHLCHVAIDSDTGVVTIERYVAVDDCGRIINPMIVEGQLHGGIAQGIAQALFEDAVYDANGQLTSGSLMDYAVPKAGFLPSFELGHTVTPSPVNSLGAKGAGEAGTIASSAAVINAVVDALSGFGITHLNMPASPQRVWRAMQGGGR
ncbi:MAG TPA: xanthine dehydrogenase family protein molybdopterin-binding subunit [Acidobacteriota bacterium]